MTVVTAKVFKAGNSQALRLPKSLRVTARTLQITPTDTGFLVTDPAAEARRLRALDKLLRLPPLEYELPRP
jgi:virulence-associated protein VagC